MSFDANLCGTPQGYIIKVHFQGSPNKYGDKTSLIEGVYDCEVITNTGVDKEMVLLVKNPVRHFTRNHDKSEVPSDYIKYGDVGSRWVTYEGTIQDNERVVLNGLGASVNCRACGVPTPHNLKISYSFNHFGTHMNSDCGWWFRVRHNWDHRDSRQREKPDTLEEHLCPFCVNEHNERMEEFMGDMFK